MMLSEDMQELVRSILAARASMGDPNPEVLIYSTPDEPIVVTESDLTPKEET